MRCDRCGFESPALKTCRKRGRGLPRFTLCSRCWEPIREEVWIVPGPLSVTARCISCGSYGSVAEFSDLSPGEPQRGTCPGCRMPS